MTNFLIIIVCLLLGIWARRSPRFPREAGRALNSFVIFLSLPALIFTQIPRLLGETPLGPRMIVPAAMPWGVFLLSWALFGWLGARRGWQRPTVGAMILTAGLGNTSFVGFPLLEALVGAEAIPIGIVIDQVGSFLAVSVLGLSVAALYSGAKLETGVILKRIATFPPFLALIAAVIWFYAGMPGENKLTPMFERIGGTLVPVALFAVGLPLHLHREVLGRRWRELGAGLAFKLLFAPAVLALIFIPTLGVGGLLPHVVLLQSGMAPMIAAAVVVSEFDLDSEIAGLMVGVGIPLSLLTVTIWHFALFGAAALGQY